MVDINSNQDIEDQFDQDLYAKLDSEPTISKQQLRRALDELKIKAFPLGITWETIEEKLGGLCK